MITRIVLPALAPALILALGLAVVAAPAAAQISVAQPTASVRYDDLDLTKTAGRDVLKRRLDRAVRNVCGTLPSRNLKEMASYKACIADARASYQGQVELALNNANARRVAVLADKLGMLASF